MSFLATRLKPSKRDSRLLCAFLEGMPDEKLHLVPDLPGPTRQYHDRRGLVSGRFAGPPSRRISPDPFQLAYPHRVRSGASIR